MSHFHCFHCFHYCFFYCLIIFDCLNFCLSYHFLMIKNSYLSFINYCLKSLNLNLSLNLNFVSFSFSLILIILLIEQFNSLYLIDVNFIILSRFIGIFVKNLIYYSFINSNWIFIADLFPIWIYILNTLGILMISQYS